MKQLIILLLLIIAFIIGFSKYNEYKRFNAPEVNYKTDKTLDLEYHNQEVVLNYNKAIEDLNSYVMMQWTVNNIDVRTPEEENDQTTLAVSNYAKKLGTIKYFENKLEKSASLKSNGLSNKEIKYIEETGSDLKTYTRQLKGKKIKTLFNAKEDINYGDTSPLIYEVQKKLKEKGMNLKVDGIFKIETLNAIKLFEERNNLFPDGKLDILTLDALFD